MHKGWRETKPDKRPVGVIINRSLLSLKRFVTNVWITSPWAKLTNFLIFTCKNAMEIGCSLSLSFLKFLKFANTLISSEYCSRKLKCALCTIWLSFGYPTSYLAGVWNVNFSDFLKAQSQSLHNWLLQRVGHWKEEKKGLIPITNLTLDYKIGVFLSTKRHFSKPKS